MLTTAELEAIALICEQAATAIDDMAPRCDEHDEPLGLVMDPSLPVSTQDLLRMSSTRLRAHINETEAFAASLFSGAAEA